MKSELEILQEQKDKIEEKIQQLIFKQSMCNHVWNDPVDDVFKKIVREVEPTRANPYNYRERIETISCLSRTCKICGKKEYALEEEIVPVAVVKRPKFR